jgi:hypothetical protein
MKITWLVAFRSELDPVDAWFAHMPGVKAALKEKAAEGAQKAAAVLAAHRYEGHSRITVTKGDLDYYVNLDDTRGDHAAAAIEFGRSGGRGGATQGINALGSAF